MSEVTRITKQPNRWWIYQKERFPLGSYALLIGTLSSACLSVSTWLRSAIEPPSLKARSVTFVVALLFFLLLRIADEFKDAQEDSLYRPYRPVPRGLVSLAELKRLGLGAMLCQFAATCWLDLRLLPFLVTVWLFWALMTKEFFVASWLKHHHGLYLISHMLLMIPIALFLTACDWLVAHAPFPAHMAWFLWLSFFNGLVLEIGRKIRAPEAEEYGVASYTHIWGQGPAIAAWLCAMLLMTFCAMLTLNASIVLQPILMVLALLFMLANLTAIVFIRRPGIQSARRIEHMTFFWVLISYLTLACMQTG